MTKTTPKPDETKVEDQTKVQEEARTDNKPAESADQEAVDENTMKQTAQTENQTLDGDQGDGEDQLEVPASDPQRPLEVLEESAGETKDRHAASLELPVGQLTDPDTQADSPFADIARDKIVPGAASGPDVAGNVVNDHGKVAYAPPGSHNAAMSGVQEDASGHVSSVHTDNSDSSGVRTYR